MSKSREEFIRSLDEPAERGTHPAALDEDRLLKDCAIEKGRASGPGGQHRNKVSTHVTITHEPTGISAQAGERRSAEQNRTVATTRLRLELAVYERVPVPAGEIRSELWRSRVAKGRISCSERHADYPAMLAEALDVIDACGFDHAKAATRLGCTPTQLVKLVAKHPPALARLNKQRQERGMRPLKR